MGISINEFDSSMKLFNQKPIPCYRFQGFEFIYHNPYDDEHRATIRVYRKDKDSKVTKAEELLSEKEEFYCEELHSIEELFTYIGKLDNCKNGYSKQLIDYCTNTVYEKILANPNFKRNFGFSFHNYDPLPELQELYQLLYKYSEMVNPFCSANWKLKNPTEYSKDVNILTSTNDYFKLDLSNNQDCCTRFVLRENYDLYYDTHVPYEKGYIHLQHNHSQANDVVKYTVHKSDRSKDSELRIDLYNFMALENDKDEEFVTKEHIDKMIKCLNFCINEIYDKIVSHMVYSEK
jgi:hypothetical protein